MPQRSAYAPGRALTSLAYTAIFAFWGPIISFLIFRLDDPPMIGTLRTFARRLNEAIILNPACQPELVPDLLDPYGQGATSQVDDIVGIFEAMGGHYNVAPDAVARPDGLVHPAVESLPADVLGFRSQRVTGSIATEVQSPMERCPGTAASLNAGIPSCLVGRDRFGQRTAGCRRVHHLARRH